MNPASVASYVQDTPLRVPGLPDLHRMTAMLLAEHAPNSAHILVVGAGGGLELRAMANMYENWRFTGVDPSAAMLGVARETTADHADRIDLIEGKVEMAPLEPFDGATCLLTLHFLDRPERLRTLEQVRRRLKPGNIFVMAHHTAIGPDPERWLARSTAFANRSTWDPAFADASARAMADRLPLVTPDEEEQLLRAAGFIEPTLFYASLSFRGWFAAAG